ncbi:MAG: UPF0236 family protein, partial [Acetobacteraceae bacterium]|nr:UPF0236 family protein [Acetobacteraceae bacterium]
MTELSIELLEDRFDRGELTFRDVDVYIVQEVRRRVRQEAGKLLERWDKRLLEGRDKGRYKYVGVDKREVEGFAGTVSFSRRRYRDVETGRSVYLLDERLKLEKSRRVSPGLA